MSPPLHIRAVTKVRHALNRVFFRYVGGNDRPVFFDVEKTLPSLRAIDENYDAIREELMAVLPTRDSIPQYHDVDEAQRSISEGDDGSWRTFFLYLYRSEADLANRDRCPRTAAVVREIPNVIQAFFSILDPGKCVPAHDGPYLGYLRYHTAFLVPENNPPKIRVKDQLYEWKEGESILFDDSWNHEVYNEADDVRVVLIVDVLRPMPWILRVLNRVGVRVMFSRIFTRSAVERMNVA